MKSEQTIANKIEYKMTKISVRISAIKTLADILSQEIEENLDCYDSNISNLAYLLKNNLLSLDVNLFNAKKIISN